MRPPHQNKRLKLIGISALALIAGVSLLLTALRENTQFFIDPSVVIADGFVSKSEQLTIGGLVQEGSVIQGKGLLVSFRLHDFEDAPKDYAAKGDNINHGHALPVQFDGILPSLFREGQGIVVTGALHENGVFVADEVLAKHDENYRPKT